MAYSVLRNTYEKYKDFVTDNVELIGEIEAALKWMSYFVAGRGKDTSPILSELMYSASNILVLVNDTIIKQAMKKATDLTVPEQYFKVALTLIEYLEVFAEVSSQKVWGSKGKWLVIAIIQLLKMALRLILLLKEKSGFLFSPPVIPLTAQQRRSAHQYLAKAATEPPCEQSIDADQSAMSKVQMTFTLKRSGRTVRTVSSAPPVMGRTWKVPVEPKPLSDNIIPWRVEEIPSSLDRNRSLAEILHVIRPMVHLFAMHSFGSQSWKPWLLACGMDITSLRLVGNHHDLNAAERGELRFRSIAVLYYLLRSPFYDKFTKERLLKGLAVMARTVPGARFLCNPLIDYLPSWQQIYFYTWSC